MSMEYVSPGMYADAPEKLRLTFPVPLELLKWQAVHDRLPGGTPVRSMGGVILLARAVSVKKVKKRSVRAVSRRGWVLLFMFAERGK
jgi:hypothetical protein